MSEDKRIGRFKVSRQCIFDGFGEIIFAGFVPYRVELLAYEDAFDCIGTHADFEPIPQGYLATEYECVVERTAAATDITGLPIGEETVTRTFRKFR
jgi:hypothetical protein